MQTELPRPIKLICSLVCVGKLDAFGSLRVKVPPAGRPDGRNMLCCTVGSRSSQSCPVCPVLAVLSCSVMSCLAVLFCRLLYPLYSVLLYCPPPRHWRTLRLQSSSQSARQGPTLAAQYHARGGLGHMQRKRRRVKKRTSNLKTQ